MKAWLFLAGAILAEVVATTALKATEGFTRTGPLVLVIAGYALAFWLLSLTLRTMSIGIAYAIWSGLGTVLIALAGWWIWGQRLDAAAVLGMALIVAGVLVMNFASRSLTH